MVTILDLWLPIVLSAIVVFLASSLVWMVLPHHKNDWGELSDEDAVIKALNAQGVKAGQFHFPACKTREQMKDPEVQKKLKEGPAGMMILRAGRPNMGACLAQYFIYCLAVSVLVAYVAGRGLAPGAAYLDVFQVAGAAALLGYSAALIPSAIWIGRSWSSVIKEVIDGVVYGLLTAGIFGWLWPAGQSAAEAMSAAG